MKGGTGSGFARINPDGAPIVENAYHFNSDASLNASLYHYLTFNSPIG